MSAPTIPAFDVEALRSAADAHAALAAVIADDIEWIDVHPKRARTTFRTRAEVLAMLDGLHANGIATTIHDGLADGTRAALTVTCALPDGMLYTNALLTVSDGKITRWFGVEAYDRP